jgi:hypothetical protein
MALFESRLLGVESLAAGFTKWVRGFPEDGLVGRRSRGDGFVEHCPRGDRFVGPRSRGDGLLEPRSRGDGHLILRVWAETL